MSPNQKSDMVVPVFCLIISLMLGASAFVCNFTDFQALFKFKAGITSDPKGYIQDRNCMPPISAKRVIDLEIIDMGLEGNISPLLSNLSLLTKLSL